MIKRSYRFSLPLALLIILCIPAFAHSAPSRFAKGLTVYNAQKAYKGLTLYYSSVANRLFLLDMEGTVIKKWPSPVPDGSIHELALPLAQGHVLSCIRLNGEGDVRKLVETDWEGKVVWEFYDPNLTFLHHDFERLDNGNTLILGSIYRTVPSVAPRELKDDVIIEVDRSGKELWRWSTLDHFAQLGLSDEARKMLYDGTYTPLWGDGRDIFHTNSIQCLPDNIFENTQASLKAGNILVSQRNTNLVFIIEKESGDIVWQMGDRSIGQHDARMIPQVDADGKNLPGAGNILLFDNGGRVGYPEKIRFYSRVLEIHPISRKIVWQYNAEKSKRHIRSFSSLYMSGAQRFPNGNTLIVESEWGRIFEVTTAGQIVWEFLNPYFDRQKFSNLFYRAYRVAPEWIPKQ